MSENESLIIAQTAEQKKQEFIILAIRAFAVLMIMVGIGVLVDVGGIALKIFGNNQTVIILGGAFCGVGLIEMLIVPFILKKAWANQPARK